MFARTPWYRVARQRVERDGWFWAGLAGFAIFLLGRWIASRDPGEFAGDVVAWLGLLFALWSWFRGPTKAQVAAVAGDIGATRQEVTALREETRRGFRDLRTEMHDGFTGVRQEMGGLRQETHDGFASLRQEMHTGLDDLRRETREMRLELAEMRRENRELLTAIRDRLPAPLP